ncbi:hypothetical protein ACFULT_22195 [Rhodococcus sp. NPDC057297]|uniref:hypothetical protein n=1 Tax=Rhodococcus sp. NPDC057297 TaxID=3346090 RepID=UPI003639012C
MTSPAPTTEQTGPAIAVEIRSLDQHQDPGFLHYRGAFYTHTAAARFALTQAAALSETRGVPEVAVSIIGDTGNAAGTNVEFIGSPAELAGELASNRNYAPGVRRTVLPPPAHVTTIVDAAVTRTPPPGIDLDHPDAVEVEVYSTRPDPLPNSRTDVGVYDYESARAVADELAEQLGGEVTPLRGDTVLRIAHAAELSEVDRESAARYTRVEELRANLAALDPVVDAEHITVLAQDLDELRSRTPSPAAREVVSSDRTVEAAIAATPESAVAGSAVDASTRPRGLVSAPPRLAVGDRSPVSDAAHRMAPLTVRTQQEKRDGHSHLSVWVPVSLSVAG